MKVVVVSPATLHLVLLTLIAGENKHGSGQARRLPISGGKEVPAMRTRVLIASDHPLSRTGLRHVLKASELEVVAEADAPGPVGELCRKFAPEVVLFEITVPGMSGLRTTASLVQAALPARTVVVANNENVHYVRSLLATGVVGYVLRKASQEELLLAIRHAAFGQRYIDPRLSDGMADVLLQAGDLGISRNPRGLSRREAQVLRAVARGFTSSEIARELELSSKTVETYRSRIYEKLGLRTRADLVHYAMALGLLEESQSEKV